MTTTQHAPGFARCCLALAIAMGVAAQASAATFDMGGIEGQFDSSLSIGASWGTAKPDKKLIDLSNGGRGFSSTGDDNRLNFKRGETFSKIFKGVHELELRSGDTSAFVRGKYWYDFELKDESRPFKQISDDGRNMPVRSSGAQFLDAFISQKYNLGELPGNVRIGRQVVSWGESTFIDNSINAINPVDVAAYRRPGSELKEALVPVNMFYVSQTLAEGLNMEGFYQLDWKPYTLDNCGTFFGNDVVAKGCDTNYTVGFADTAGEEPLAASLGLGYGLNGREGVYLRRQKDREPGSGGQYGMALRWMGQDTEYAAYYLNYHSRIPLVGTHTASGVLAAAPTLFEADPSGDLALATALGNSSYFLEYPKAIHLFGLSFATQLPTGSSWSGELSYRPNMPLQLNTTDLTYAVLNPLLDGTAAPTIPSEEGQDNHGYKRKPVIQAQSTIIHLFGPTLGAESLAFIGEVGVTHINALGPKSEERFDRDSVFGEYGVNYGTGGFYTSTSWGYRMRGELEYGDVIAGINLKPNLAWSHDVNGYGPVFNEGSKAVSVGLDADYANTYKASISYTNYFGGDFNTNVDRDYVALSFGVNF